MLTLDVAVSVFVPRLTLCIKKYRLSEIYCANFYFLIKNLERNYRYDGVGSSVWFIFRQHRIDEMLPIATDVSVCHVTSLDFGVQKRLNGSRSCSG